MALNVAGYEVLLPNRVNSCHQDLLDVFRHLRDRYRLAADLYVRLFLGSFQRAAKDADNIEYGGDIRSNLLLFRWL